MTLYKNKYNKKVKDFGTRKPDKLKVLGWEKIEPEKEQSKNTKNK